MNILGQAECPLAGPVNYQARTFYANMAVDVLTDILIISIPFIILHKVQISWRKKAGLLGIFSVAILIMVFSIIRVTLVKGTQIHLQQASIDWLYFWSNIDMGVGKSQCTMPSIPSTTTVTSAKQLIA